MHMEETTVVENHAQALPGTPRWSDAKKRFEEEIDVDPQLLEDLGLKTTDIGYSFLEPQKKPELFLLRGLQSGFEKSFIENRGKLGEQTRKSTVWCACLLQRPSGELVTWELTSKKAYLQLLRAVGNAPASDVGLELAGDSEKHATPRRVALRYELSGTIPLWIGKVGEGKTAVWSIRLGTAQERLDVLDLLAAAE